MQQKIFLYSYVLDTLRLMYHTYGMNCANCGEQMLPLTRDDHQLLHCPNCGASFFADNIVNRITLESAQYLAENKLTNNPEHIAALKKCPKDGAVMLPILNSEALPRSVTLFHCKLCNGLFAGATELVKFKEAQQVKVHYYKVWEMPLPRLQSVLIIFMIALLTGSVYLSVSSINQSAVYRSEASELIQKVNLFKSGRYILITFRTTTPFTSEIILRNQTADDEKTKPIMKLPNTQHFATLSDVNISDEIYFKIRLTDSRGKFVETVERRLELKTKN